MKTRVVVLCLALASAALAQAGFLTLSVTPSPAGFGSLSTTACGPSTLESVLDVVRTEQLLVSLTSAPTVGTPAPVPATRRVALVLGPKDCSGLVAFAGNPVFIDVSPSAPLPFVVVFDSFSVASDPVFPAVLTPTSIAGLSRANLFGPYGGPMLPPLVLQAIAEDLPGSPSPWLVSNAVELNVIDPQGSFPPDLTGVTSPISCPGGAPGPGGPEAGGTTITIHGTNFLVQSDSTNYPPAVLIGTVPATNVSIVSQTAVTAVTPAVAQTCPPFTAAGQHNVSLQNDLQISPGAQFDVSPIKFTYCSGRMPATATLSLASALPEGGQSLVITGTDFLHGADVIFTAQGNPSLTTTISPPDPMIVSVGPCSTTMATPTTITLATPPACTGPVTVTVVNPDGVPSNPVATLVYSAQVPAVNPTISPMTTIAGLGGQTTWSAMTDTGTQLLITGSNFLTPSSALFGAPTVPQSPSLLFPSRTEILAGPTTLFASTPASSGVMAPNLIQVTPSIGDQTGEFRPGLGVKSLRVVNPPCLGTNGLPVASVPVQILIQDADPPMPTTVFPDVITQSAAGGVVSSFVEISGSNFFTLLTPMPLPVSASYAPGVLPQLDAMSVPAVAFGTEFSPEVELVSVNLIRARVPAGLALQSIVPIKVFNPDGRSATANGTVRIVPRLTDPTKVTQNMTASGGFLVDLDAATLMEISNPATNPFRFDQAILFVPNPTPNDDRLEDIANGGDPAVTSDPSAYDACFLFNTRINSANPNNPYGQMRFFDFRAIDVPATITLPAPVNVGNAVLAAGVKRVIFKATAFYVVPAQVPNGFLVTVYADEGFPFVLRSHDDFNFGGMLDVSGDSIVSHAFATSPTLKFQLRCEWQYPPAGGGIGGRGGLHYLNALQDVGTTASLLVIPQLPGTLSQPSLGTSANVLTGTSGYAPRTRTPGNPEPATGGRYGLGRAPIGGMAGGGAGGGYATAGGAGQAGATSSAAPISATWGNSSNLPTSTTGFPGLGDPYVYGSTAADFNGPLGLATSAFPRGLFSGGSGGGGGGGSLAIVVPAVSNGGRGGNGGGSAVLLSDRVFKLGPYGRIFADGEKGQLGIDAFPFANGEPLFVLCAPGSGGGGAGGLVFIAAVADADLSVPILNPGQRILSATGGPGGAPTGQTTVTTAHGGNGGDGRIRVAINMHSGMVGLRQSQFQMKAQAVHQNFNIAPDPGVTVIDFFRYQSP